MKGAVCEADRGLCPSPPLLKGGAPKGRGDSVPEDAPPPFDDSDAPPPPEDAPPYVGDGHPAVPVDQYVQGGPVSRPYGHRTDQDGCPHPPEDTPAPVPRAPTAVSWAALRARLEQSMGIADFCFVGNGDMVSGTAESGVVTLWAHTDFVKGFIDKPDILKQVADAARALTGADCRVQVKVGKPPAPAPAGDPLDALMGLENVTVT